MSEVRHPIGTPVLLKERKSADLSDGHIVTSVGVSVTEIGFIGEAYKAGFDDGYSAREWRYNVVFPYKGIVKGLSNFDLVVTEFEKPDIPEMKEARRVWVGSTLKDDEGNKFIVTDLGTVHFHTVTSETVLYFKGPKVIGGDATYLTEVGVMEQIAVYEK